MAKQGRKVGTSTVLLRRERPETDEERKQAGAYEAGWGRPCSKRQDSRGDGDTEIPPPGARRSGPGGGGADSEARGRRRGARASCRRPPSEQRALGAAVATGSARPLGELPRGPFLTAPTPLYPRESLLNAVAGEGVPS